MNQVKHSMITLAATAAALLACGRGAQAGPFTATVFARGADVGATRPDSITTDGSHVFIEYSNGASAVIPPGQDGSSTIAEYDLAGRILTTFSVPGSADGLRYNAATNQVWALQNQDGNSTLTTIDATTGTMAHYTYNPTSPSRGYDDAAFVGGKAFLSYSNPGNSTDPSPPIIYQATLGNGTIALTTVLNANATGTNTATGQAGPIPVTDPDSLNLRPDGSLLLTGGDDGTLTTVRNPGTGSQAVSFVKLVTANGAGVSGLDDTVFAAGSDQRLLVADTANNLVYAVTGPFQVGGAYSSIGDTHSLDSVDMTTGLATSISDGLFGANASPHGLQFISAVPEPSSLALTATGAAGVLAFVRRRRRS